MMVRRGIGMRGLGRGLGQTIPNPANYSAWGDFLNAAMLANGIQPGSCNSPLTCNSITEFQAIYQAAVQAWQGLNSPTGSIVQQQAQQNAAANAALIAANAPAPVVVPTKPPTNIVSVAAPTPATTPSQVTAVASPSPSSAQATLPYVTALPVAPAPASASPCAFALFGETSCIGPIGSTTLLVLGGAALLLFSMSGKR